VKLRELRKYKNRELYKKIRDENNAKRVMTPTMRLFKFWSDLRWKLANFNYWGKK